MELKALIIFSLFELVLTRDYVDPHDMNTQAKQKYLLSLRKTEVVNFDEHRNSNTDATLCGSYLQHIVSRLANVAHINKEDPEIFDGHIRFKMEPSDFYFLVDFPKGELTLDNLKRLDKIISDSFHKSLINDYLDTLEWYQLKIYTAIFNVYNLWILGLLFMLYVVYELFKNKFSFVYILKYLIIVLLIGDFGFRYQALLEEAEKHNLEVIYSAQCDTNKMSWGEYTKFLFSSRNCETKTVTPLDVFLYQIKCLIVVPLRALGTGFGGFGKEMLVTLPLGLNIVMWPLMLIFVMILAIFCMSFISGQCIEINLLFAKFKFGEGRQQNNAIQPTVIPVLLQRSLIQEVLEAAPNSDTTIQEDQESPTVPTVDPNRNVEDSSKATEENKYLQEEATSDNSFKNSDKEQESKDSNVE